MLQKKIDDSKILDEDIAKINEVLNRLSEETLTKIIDKIDIPRLIQSYSLSEEFIESNLNRLKPCLYSIVRNQYLSERFLEKYQDILDWINSNTAGE